MQKRRGFRMEGKVWKLRQPASSTALSSPSRACSRTKVYCSMLPPFPYFIPSCLSRSTTAHFGGESKRGHDPDKVGTGVSCPYGAEEAKSRASRAGPRHGRGRRDEFRPPLRLETKEPVRRPATTLGETDADTRGRLDTAVRIHRFGELAQTHAGGRGVCGGLLAQSRGRGKGR